MIVSERPPAYTSALSKKLTPASYAAARQSLALSPASWGPKLTHEPKERTLTLRPDRPRRRYCISMPRGYGTGPMFRVHVRGRPVCDSCCPHPVQQPARARAAGARTPRLRPGMKRVALIHNRALPIAAIVATLVALVATRLPHLSTGPLDFDEGVYWLSMRSMRAGNSLFTSVLQFPTSRVPEGDRTAVGLVGWVDRGRARRDPRLVRRGGRRRGCAGLVSGRPRGRRCHCSAADHRPEDGGSIDHAPGRRTGHLARAAVAGGRRAYRHPEKRALARRRGGCLRRRHGARHPHQALRCRGRAVCGVRPARRWTPLENAWPRRRGNGERGRTYPAADG